MHRNPMHPVLRIRIQEGKTNTEFWNTEYYDKALLKGIYVSGPYQYLSITCNYIIPAILV
jgi:hypothetical protein